MRRLYLYNVLLFSFLVIFSLPATAQEAQGPYVRVRLVPEHGTIAAGQEIGIAIEQSIAPGWHTYWKNPGDSGASPRVKWALPEGFTMSEIEWPVPHKLPYGPLLNFGYEDNVILLQKIKAPENFTDGPVTLKADIDILVCKEICIPETGTYELTLNGAEAADNSGYFTMAREKLPVTSSGTASYYEQDGFFILEKEVDWGQPVARYDFIPAEWGVIENIAAPEITVADNKITIRQKRGQRSLSELSEIPGLLLWSMSTEEPSNTFMNAYEFTASPGIPGDMPVKTSATPQQTTFLAALLFALFGGLVLNLMPCVFPVLSIKALSLVKIAEKQPGIARLHGIAYTAGVIASFLAIAGLLLALKAGGAQIGWGFQLQSPEIVTLLAWLLFIVGLNLSGIFEIGGSLGNVGNRLTQGNTPGHSFFTGVLATLVATPCTAPFMGVALGFALVQPAIVSLIIFAALGFGLALPYLLLSIVPALQKMLPRPGAWMGSFKQFLAFPMYASAAWLVWVLSQQSGPMGVFAALMGLVLIAFGIWLLRHEPVTMIWKNLVRVLALLSFLAALLLIPSGPAGKTDPSVPAMGEAYDPAKLAGALEGSEPVFVEMTAAWCITCKVNHAIAIDVNSTKKVFADNAVRYFIGDWTNQDPGITKYLNEFGRSGVPIYVYYGPRDANGTRPEPVLLPQILTPGIVAKAVTGN